MINCYDREFKLKDSFLNVSHHFEFPFYSPSKKKREKLMQGRFDEFTFKKVITKKDHLIALSNHSLKVFHFDERNKLVNEFRIENEMLLESIKKVLKSTRDRENVLFLPLSIVFLDGEENLCLAYRPPLKSRAGGIYRYKRDGSFRDVVKFHGEGWMTDMCADSLGNFYAIVENRTKIKRYRIEKFFMKGGE